MKDYIFIDSLRVDAIIGIHPHERTSKQPLILDIKMFTDTTNAVLTENVKHCVDYQIISEQLIEFVSQSTFQLIETLAETCANQLLSHPLIHSVELKVSKPQALDCCKNVGLVIFRSK